MKRAADVDRLTAGAELIEPQDGLPGKLALGRPLRVKLGLDPTRPDLHLGHAVLLRKLRQFQDAGHLAVLIVGDYTARIGDPSGRSELRPSMSVEQIEANARTYLDQAGKVIRLEEESLELRRNSEWLAPMGMDEVLRLTSSVTVAQMLERDDFHARYAAHKPISLVEFLYPLLQGQDSVAVEADVELGGTDQTFNLLMGRELQKAALQDPQVVLTMPLIEGTDGVRKMSKSYNNYVGLTDPPEEMFGRLMRVPDGLIAKYMRLCTALGHEVADEVERGLADGSARAVEQKRRMAREVVDLYHGMGAGRQAEAAFDRVHKERELPEEIAVVPVPEGAIGANGRVFLPKLLVLLELVSSSSEGRRLILQKGVRIDSRLISDPNLEISVENLHDSVVQIGRRRFVRLVVQDS
ncbi:MAG: tyrosine--tRNA ligase [Actinomycetota bacterium]